LLSSFVYICIPAFLVFETFFLGGGTQNWFFQAKKGFSASFSLKKKRKSGFENQFLKLV